MGWENGLSTLRYGPEHREQRKKVSRVIGSHAAVSGLSILLEGEVRRCIFKVTMKGVSLESALRRSVQGFYHIAFTELTRPERLLA